MKKQTSKKILVDKKPNRALDASELQQVAGGIRPFWFDLCDLRGQK